MGSDEVQNLENEQIIFFDGVCNLCNWYVEFAIKVDKKGALKFASLQGETAKQLLTQEQRESLKSLMFYQKGQTYEESEAVLKAMIAIGGIWKAAYLAFIIPGFLRDAVYRWVARNRYRFFGQRETCRVPSPEERSRLLD